MRATWTLLAVLGAAWAAQAAPPKLEIKPEQIKEVNGYVRFTPETDAKSVVYVALDGVYPFPSEELKDARRFLLNTQGLKAGKYRFVAVGTLNDEQVVTPFEVPVGNVPPGPGPVPPTPNPPEPAPVRKDVSYRIVFVEETSEATGSRGALLTSKTLDARMKEKGHSIRVVDKDVVDDKGQVPKDLVDILKLAAAKKYPQVFLVDKAGKLPTLQFDAPEGAAAVIKLLTDNGG